MRDMHSNIKVVHAIAPQAVGTSGIGGGKTSAIIDRRGFESVEFVFGYGTTATVADQVVPVIRHADATGDSFTSVADADLLPATGGESAVTLSAAGHSKVGYRGNKRYLTFQLYGVGHATGLVNAAAILGNPQIAPVAS